ncbi:MAG: GMC family oxidoreductase [Salinarimonas sp.]
MHAQDEEAFDYVIVGGGAAGCVLAARLSEDPRVSVVLLEAGGTPRSPWIEIPAAFGKTWKDPRFNWNFATQPEPGTHDRRIAVPRGKSLGGSTLINGSIFVRGQAQDYDGWAQSGARGWSFEEVLPYFRRLERFIDDTPDALRGRDGPLDVVRVRERHPLLDAFIEAGIEAGHPRNPDYNGTSQEGFGYYQVTQRAGRRWSAYRAYLEPAMRRPNLTVRTHAQAMRVLIEDGRAAGIVYRRDGRDETLRAKAEVVLAAGAVQTPQLLELSGIGDGKLLSRHGIEVVLDAPGVGANYQDHFATRMNWRVTKPITLNEQTRGWRLALAVADYILRRRGILTLATGLAHGFVRTRPECETPDIQYFFVHASYADAADRKLDREPGMTIGVTQLRPQSRGSIHIGSPDPFAMPEIRPNFLADPQDQDCLVAGMHMAREIMSQAPMEAFRGAELNPGPAVASDVDLLDFARRTGQTIYHPIGTCAMGSGPEAVVDPQLRLRGIKGLRVADASVMPRIVSANTMAAVMMIAERASDLIHEERAGRTGIS